MHEGKMLIGIAPPTDTEPLELVQPGEASLHDSVPGAEPRAVLFTATGDQEA